jgi:hypothetical protein
MYAVWFDLDRFKKSIQNPIRRFSQKGPQNTSKNIRFFTIFGFFGSICDFYLDWSTPTFDYKLVIIRDHILL